MLTSVEGIFQDGKIEFKEPLPEGMSGRVIVTFLPSAPQRIDLASRGINKEMAAELRARLSTFAEDWDRPEMDVYDID
jgi:hypothetical protein